tara:strand:- start:1051 stop:1323 length:273 start_codon:yes stop_codon:yes gene_type:complete
MKFDYWGNPYKWSGMDQIEKLLSLYEQRKFLYQDIYIEHRIKELLAEGYHKEDIIIEARLKPDNTGYTWEVTSGATIKEKLPKDGEDWEE